MNSIIDRIKQNRLWDFPGGVHPKQFKSLSNKHEIAEISLPEKLYIPVKQHIGVEGNLIVSVGDLVLKGQPLSHSSNPFSVPIHAPTSGEVVAIEEHVSAHPSGRPEITVILKPDGLEKWADLTPITHYQDLPKASVVEHLCQSGIAGMGGAGFPTHIKVGSDKPIKYVVINGIECEPYITSDDRLMREHAWQIRQGIDVLMHLLQPEYAIVAIEDNKPEAIQAMQVACQDADNYLVTSVPTKYPAGGEKQLIEVLTGQQIPKGKHPVDVGIVMQNVGTCFAIADAVFAGKPLIQRVVTLTGKALSSPQNVWGLIGTPISHMLDIAQYQAKKQKSPRVIVGGPMMGFTAASTDVPIVKISNCLLVPAKKELPLPQDEMPCIRCGACADACPAGLLPQQLYWHAKAGELEKAQEFNIADCIECGACAFVCPSNIPLVQYYRTAKADIKIAQEEKEKSDKAKARFNARQERLEREKQEREEKRLQSARAREEAKAAREARTKASAAPSPESKKAESDSLTNAATNTANTPANDNRSDKVAAAIARAKAKKAAAQAAANGESNTAETPEALAAKEPATEAPAAGQSKDDRVAAAIARAKAKKAAAKEPATEAPAAGQSKDDRVAAAIARAKAKKAEREAAANTTKQEAATKDESNTAETPEAPATKEPATEAPAAGQSKDDRVAAAIARAKAKKAEREAAANATEQEAAANGESNTAEAPEALAAKEPATEAPAAGQSKDERVAAAIARAKAKKAEREAAANATEQEADKAESTQSRDERVAAAIAKAKARKLEREQAAQNSSENNNQTPKGEQ